MYRRFQSELEIIGTRWCGTLPIHFIKICHSTHTHTPLECPSSGRMCCLLCGCFAGYAGNTDTHNEMCLCLGRSMHFQLVPRIGEVCACSRGQIERHIRPNLVVSGPSTNWRKSEVLSGPESVRNTTHYIPLARVSVCVCVFGYWWRPQEDTPVRLPLLLVLPLLAHTTHCFDRTRDDGFPFVHRTFIPEGVYRTVPSTRRMSRCHVLLGVGGAGWRETYSFFPPYTHTYTHTRMHAESQSKASKLSVPAVRCTRRRWATSSVLRTTVRPHARFFFCLWERFAATEPRSVVAIVAMDWSDWECNRGTTQLMAMLTPSHGVLLPACCFWGWKQFFYSTKRGLIPSGATKWCH